MARTNKVWRVLAEYDGQVTLEQESKHVIISNNLSQEELAALALNPVTVAFLEQVAQPAVTDGK